MKLLFILTDDYPYAGACTNILNHFFFEGHLIEKFKEIHILTFAYNQKELRNDRYQNVYIHRIQTSIYYEKSELKNLFLKDPIKALIGIFYKIYIRKAKKFLFPFQFPEKSISRLITRELEIINANDFDTIIPVAGWFETIQGVVDYKKKHKGNSKILLYQVDPCATNFLAKNTFFSRKKFENEVYEFVDKIITTPIILEEQRKIDSERVKEKFVSIEFPNIIIKKSLPPINVSDSLNNKIRCLFSGSIYKNIRNPNYTFKLFEKLNNSKIEFHLVGVEKRDVKGANIEQEERFVFHGRMDIRSAEKMLNEADILVNIGNTPINQVPSKLFEYISTGKPIINICKSEMCPTLCYLKKYPLALNLFENRNLEEQVVLLNNFIINNSGKNLSKEYIENLYEECTAYYCAEKFLDTVLSLKS